MCLSQSQFVLAVKRSHKAWSAKHVNLWKLMLRDGLNLYAVSRPITLSAEPS